MRNADQLMSGGSPSCACGELLKNHKPTDECMVIYEEAIKQAESLTIIE